MVLDPVGLAAEDWHLIELPLAGEASAFLPVRKDFEAVAFQGCDAVRFIGRGRVEIDHCVS